MSSESEDGDFKAQHPVKQSKQEQNVSTTNALYHNFLNANNKFTEMLKSKIKQSEISPILKHKFNDSRDYEFNPTASSTQIGTPNELKHRMPKSSKLATASKLLKVVKSDSGSSSDEHVNRSKKQKQDIIEISSTIMRDTSSSDHSDLKDSKTNESDDSDEKHSKSKNSGSDKSTSNTDSDASTKQLNQVKSKKNNQSPLSDQTHPRKTTKLVKTVSDTSSSASDTDTESTDDSKIKPSTLIKPKANSKKCKKYTSNSNVDLSDNGKTDKVKQKLITKTQKKSNRNTSSSSESDSEEPDNSNLKKKNSKQNFSKDDEDSTSSSENDSKIKQKKKHSQKQHDNSGKDLKSSQRSKRKKAGSSSSSEDEVSSSRKNLKKSSSENSSNSSGDEFLKEKSNRGVGSPYVRLKNYEQESSLQRLEGSKDFLKKINPKEEVFLLQVPIKLDPKSLVGVNISLSEAVRLDQHKKYESVPSLKAQDSVSLFCNSDDERIQIVKPMGYIRIQRYLKDKSIAEVPQCGNNSVLFPHDLKERHPLFGSDYTSKINLEEHIKQKLAAAVEIYTKKKKKKEKQKKVSAGDRHVQQEEEIFKFLNQSVSDVSSSKKVKKSKTSMNETGADEKAPSKKKEKKYTDLELEPSTSSANDSFKKKKKKSKYNHSVDETDATDGKKRKKKKLDDDFNVKKKSKLETSNEDSLIQQLLFNETATLYKKKKKKRRKSEAEDE